MGNLFGDDFTDFMVYNDIKQKVTRESTYPIGDLSTHYEEGGSLETDYSWLSNDDDF